MQVTTRTNGHAPPDALDQDSLEALHAQARALGIDVSRPDIQARIAARRETAAETTSRTARFATKADEALTAIGQIVATGLYLLFARLALPIAILPLWYVEIQRVETGLSEIGAAYSRELALTVVTTFLVLRLVRADRAWGRVEGEGWRFSLGIWWEELKYFLGVQRGWKREARDGLWKLDGALRGLAIVIVLLGTAGTLTNVLNISLKTITGEWLATRTVLYFFQVVGGLGLTAALLGASHWLLGYIYAEFRRLRPEAVSFSGRSAVVSGDAAEREYLRFLIQRQQERNRDRAGSASASSSSVN